MNGEMHMPRRFAAKVRYSAAYPTGAERSAKGSSLPDPIVFRLLSSECTGG